MKYLSKLIFFSIILSNSYGQENKINIFQYPQNINARFKLYDTQNIWTKLELDSRTGKIWQVNFSVSVEGITAKKIINGNNLVANPLKDGRFALFPTENMWNFILLDQEDGRVWQVQYSLNDNNQFIFKIE